MRHKILASLKEEAEKCHHSLSMQLKETKLGKVSIEAVNNLQVNYHGSYTPIQSLATILLDGDNTLAIKTWSKDSFGPIQKSLSSTGDYNVRASADTIYITPPLPSSESRNAMVKSLKQLSEHFKTTLRSLRKKHLDMAKKEKDSSLISEDDYFVLKDEIQDIIDTIIKKVSKAIDDKVEEVTRS